MTATWLILLGMALGALGFKTARFWTTSLIIAYWTVWLCIALVHWPAIDFASTPWSTALNIQWSYHLDGLSRLFMILISGIGILIFAYAPVYCQYHPADKKKLIALLQLFATSMALLVLSDDLIQLFLAWELTTVTSYLLIQFKTGDTRANQAAFNGMFISVLGALVMLAGFILLAHNLGSWSISTVIAQGHRLSSSTLTWVAILLIVGAVTKSAQFPFYFWLPGAMKAPTPVSAYLHSATMVNAGIYLLARFHPLLSPLPFWSGTLTFFGLSTMLIASIMSLAQKDLKAILAYTTLFALGSMVYLLGAEHGAAIEAFGLFLFFHALYKAGAFMWVGTIDQEYKTRQLSELKGIAHRRPLLAFTSVILFSAMAGLPPFFGFTAKEMIYEAKLVAPSISWVLMAIGLASSMLICVASLKCLVTVFSRTNHHTAPRQATLTLGLLGSIVLSVIILLLNALEPWLKQLLSSLVHAVAPNSAWAYTRIQSWQVSSLSALTVAGGVALFILLLWKPVTPRWPQKLDPLWLFEQGLAGMVKLGRRLTLYTQYLKLSTQLFFIVLLTIILISVLGTPLLHQTHWRHALALPHWPTLLTYATLVCAAAFLLCSKRLMSSLFALGVFGLSLSFFFILKGAPDVAMTQLLIEILTVIIIAIALRKVPNRTLNQAVFIRNKWKTAKALCALAIGALTGALAFLATHGSFNPMLSTYYIQNSLPQAFGHNVVNVILVDFRSFDTLGEAIVIFATGVGIWLLTTNHKHKER